MMYSRARLLDANHSISSELELPHLYWAIITKATQLLSWYYITLFNLTRISDGASLFLVDSKTGELYLAPSSKENEMVLIPPGKSVSAQVAASGNLYLLYYMIYKGELIHIPDVASSSLFNPSVDKPKPINTVTNLVAVPVFNSKSVMGTIPFIYLDNEN